MSEIDLLEQSIDASIRRIETAAKSVAPPSETHAELSAQNERLKAELQTLTARRKADLAELDELLAQLKPMMEER